MTNPYDRVYAPTLPVALRGARVLRRGRRGVLLLAVIAIVAAGCGRTDSLGAPADQCVRSQPVVTGTTVRVLDHDGEQRSYRMHLPAGYDGSTRTPVVVLFHGLRGNPATMMRTTNMTTLADEEGFILIAPEARGPSSTWDYRSAASTKGSDLGFVEELLSQVKAEECVDSDRTFAAGFSNGSAMTMALACDESSEFAAYAGVAGPYIAEPCVPPTPRSIIYFHGLRDTVIPYAGGETSIGPLPGVDEVMSYWTVHDDCPTAQTSVDGGVRHVVRDRCERGSAVEVYTVGGGRHGWPGAATRVPGSSRGIMDEDLDGTALIWRFFADHPRRGQ